MTNLDKIQKIVSSNVTKEQIINWAYVNRETVHDLKDEPLFEHMENSINKFYKIKGFDIICSESSVVIRCNKCGNEVESWC